MASKKTYRVVGPTNQLSVNMKVEVPVTSGDTTIMVPRYLSLKGHLRPRRKKGEITISDPALIKALDQRIERAGVGTRIVCVDEVKIKDSEVQQTPNLVKTKNGEVRFEDDVRPGEVKAQYVPPPKVVTGVTTVQAAKEYLLKEFKDDGIGTRDVSNLKLVTQYAAKKNINFVDLKQ